MADNGWVTLPFDQAVLVNPPVRLERGEVYPFVDMQAVDPGSRSVGPSELREFKGGGSRFMNGDTLMARITPCLENGKIARYAASKAEEVGHGSTEFIVIRGRPNVTDNGFAYYLTKWDGVRQYCISQMTGSSGRQRVPTSALSHREVTIPPLKEQEAIACILGTLDDKIELNRQLNRTLEDIARAIFKSWFVDFDPVRAKCRGGFCRGGFRTRPYQWPQHILDLFPDRLVDSELGEIPEGWEVGTLGDLVDYVVDRIQPSDFTKSHPYVPIECIETRSVCLINSQSGCNAKSSLVQFRKGDILFGAMRPYFHKVCIAPFDGTTRSTAFVLRPVATELAYTAFVVSRDETINYATAHSEGSTIPYAKWSGSLQNMNIVLPMQNVREAYHRSIWPLIERMMANVLANNLLAALRDALLPKLISGELRVPDAERIVGRCV